MLMISNLAALYYLGSKWKKPLGDAGIACTFCSEPFGFLGSAPIAAVIPRRLCPPRNLLFAPSSPASSQPWLLCSPGRRDVSFVAGPEDLSWFFGAPPSCRTCSERRKTNRGTCPDLPCPH